MAKKPQKPFPSTTKLKPDYVHGSGSLYVGDANVVMPKLASAGVAGTVDLGFFDPPFNIGHDYGDFRDKVEENEYQQFTRDWVRNAVTLIRPGGSMFMHLPDQVAPYAFVQARHFGMVHYRTIILHQEFGQYGEGNFINSHVQLLYFVKPGGVRTWNVEEILEPSQRLKAGDSRTTTAKFKGKRPMLDVWYGEHLGRVQGNNDERWCHGKRMVGKVNVDKLLSPKATIFTHPNQLPEMYVARIIRCASNKGDLIFDGFTGSGTTWAVANALERNWKGAELTGYVAESAHARVKYRGAIRPVNGPLQNGLSKVE